MTNNELEIIVKIFEYKEIKSGHIHYQRYSDAADARDKERFYEWKLMKFLGYSDCSNIDKEKKLNEYFIKNLGIEYTKKITPEFKKSILRQMKLNELGI
jgi:hypothetical protein